MRRKLPIIIIVGVLLVALAGGALLMHPSRTLSTATLPSPSTPTPRAVNTPGTSTTRPAVATTVAPGTHLRGRSDAPVLLEEYADFQCPPCGFVHPILKRLESEYETQLRVAFHHFPLRTTHKHAAEAARAAEAAGVQGKFWQMHDLLFEKQKEWKDAPTARPLFLTYARTLGLDLEKFTRDIDSTVISNRVMNDETSGAARGVTGTPTVYLNGRELAFEDVTNYNTLRALIEREIAAKK